MDLVWNVFQSWIFENISWVSSNYTRIREESRQVQARTELNGGASMGALLHASPSQAQHPPRRYTAMDGNCPICLNQFYLPFETNCGHVFCAQCIVIYLQQSQWRNGPIKCPVCRQHVSILLPCFNQNQLPSVPPPSQSVPTSPVPDDLLSSPGGDAPPNGTTSTVAPPTSHDHAHTLIREVNRYNRRNSGEPRPWFDYLYDLPTLLRHLSSDFFSFSGLMYMFRIRIVLCFVAAVMYLISPLDMIPEAVFGIFGLFDDIVVMLLLAIYVTIIYRRYLSTRWGDDDD